MENGTSFTPASEVHDRIKRLQHKIREASLDGALICEHTEMLYYTGTIQNGALFVPADWEPQLFIRRNVERARLESPMEVISEYTSFKDIINVLKKRALPFGRIGIDEHSTTMAHFKVLKKHFVHSGFGDISHSLRGIRAVKSAYELGKIKQAAEVARTVISKVPEWLVPGITEWELCLRLFQEIAMLGNSCVGRLMFNSGDFFMGLVGFGDSTNHPTAFDGPAGMPGKSPACPHAGSDRPLKPGDLIFIDAAYPSDEYYVDKTRVFSLGKPDPKALEAHAICLDIQESVRKRLQPGAIPSKIYEEVFDEVVLPKGFSPDFMGFGSNQVKFLGHGVGMAINEYPVIANKFDDPLEENMILAVEPKKGLKGLGMVGIENTFQVMSGGGLNLTEDNDEILVV